MSESVLEITSKAWIADIIGKKISEVTEEDIRQCFPAAMN